MSQCGWPVRLCGRGLCGPQLAGCCLVLDWSLGEAAVGERLPAHLPQFRAGRHVPFLKHGASVVPDLITVTDPQPRRAGRRDDMLTIGTPGEMSGVWRLRFGHLGRDR